MARSDTKRRSDSGVDTNPEFATIDDSYDDEDRPRGGARPRPVKRARVGVVVLAVLVTEIVLIGAALNQGVSKHLASYSREHPDALLGRFVRSLLVLRWRISPDNGMSDLWHTELISVGLVLLLGIVLVPMVVHGAVNWLRAFVGIWMTVTVGTVVAVVAALVLSDLEESRDLTSYVVPGTPTTGLTIPDRIGDAAFGPVASYAFVAGLALGLVTALIVATVVIASRRTDPVPVQTVAAEPPAAAQAPEPFFGDTPRPERLYTHDASAQNDTRAYAPPAQRDEDDAPTSSLRRTGVGGIAGAGAGAGLGYAAGRSGRDEPADQSGTASNEPASNETAAMPRVDEPAPGETAAMPRVDQPARDADAAPPSDDTDPGTTSELRPVDERSAGAGTPAEPARDEVEPARDEVAPARADTQPARPEPARADSEPDADAERTAAFPLPPDDEDLGHDPHHDND